MGLTVVFPEDEFGGLWEDHLPAWRAWSAVSMQLRAVAVSSMAGGRVVWLGLDYAAAKAGLELAGIVLTPAQWAEVRVIEAGAMTELNRER